MATSPPILARALVLYAEKIFNTFQYLALGQNRYPMKKLTCLFALITILLSANTLRAQYVTIPDTAFVAFLTNNYPSIMSGNQMDTTANVVESLITMDCSNKGIADLTGVEYFDVLRELRADDNIIDSVCRLPETLEKFYASRNLINAMHSFPNGLINVFLVDNNLSALLPLPATLVTIDASENNITYVPPIPPGLRSLRLRDNLLTSLPAIPSSLLTLEITNNNILSLPALPATLRDLYIGGNTGITLPAALPPSLRTFSCNEIGASSFNLTLPDTLWSFNCSRNNLTALPVLPDSMVSFNCSFNPGLQSIPALPERLEVLIAMNCDLRSLPEFPDSMNTIWVHNNQQLTCLPQLKQVNELFFYGTAVTCLPNYGQVGFSNPSLAGVPLCNLFNDNDCGVYYNISGSTYFDADSSCNYSAGETRLAPVKINLYESGSLRQQMFTGGAGFYSFDLDQNYGSYSVSADSSNLPFVITCPDTGYYDIDFNPQDTLFFNQDFGIQCRPGFDVGVFDITRGWDELRPASGDTIRIIAGDIAQLYGVSCTNVAGQVKVVVTGPITLRGYPGLQPTNVVGDTITWDVADFSVPNIFSSFQIDLAIDTPAQFGDVVCFDVSVTPTVGDNNLTNNQLSHCFLILNSYDPNNKEVYPFEGYIDSTVSWLTYTINFQNTGNASAQHIYILDTLDSNLDVGSMQLLSYSHDNLTEVLPGGIIKFNFPNIYLPDSNSNEPESHGYIRFKIKLKDNLAVGTYIQNTAYIYFDFNPPIITNTTEHVIYNGLGQPDILANNLQACQGDSVTLQINTLVPTDVQWFRDGVGIPNTNSYEYKASQSGSYSVQLDDGITTVMSNAVDVTIDPLPTVSLTLPQDSFCVTDSAIDLSGYASPAGGSFTGAGIAAGLLDVSNIGTYVINYNYTDIQNCSDKATASIQVTDCTVGLPQLSANDISIYPNPATDQISIKAMGNTGNIQVTIVDVSGRVVVEQSFTGSELSIDTRQLPADVYIMLLRDAQHNLITTRRLAVVR